jgi:hypothetical protein
LKKKKQKRKEENNMAGVWRTVSGRRIFIEEGQSLSDAMRGSGKFEKVSETLSKYKNKQEFIDYIEDQTKVKLDNPDNFMNKKRDVLYTEIPQQNKSTVLGFLEKKNIKYENHIGNKYWIRFKQ